MKIQYIQLYRRLIIVITLYFCININDSSHFIKLKLQITLQFCLKKKYVSNYRMLVTQLPQHIHQITPQTMFLSTDLVTLYLNEKFPILYLFNKKWL